MASHILQLSQQELEQAIDAELNENPALERLQGQDEPLLEDVILKSISPHTLKPRGDDRELWRSLPVDDDTPGWIDLASSNTTLAEHLAAQLHQILPSSLRHIADFVIGCLNDNGYLYEPVEEIALATNSSIEDADQVLTALKSCDPVGVGANGIQECLLLQLKDHQTIEGKLARKIVKLHLDEFTSNKRMRIARRYSVMPDVVDEAFELILGCSPFPADGFRPSNGAGPRLPAVQPDLVLHRSEHGWEIQVRGPEASDFAVNSLYRSKLDQANEKRVKDADEKRHLTHYVQRANDFISSIAKRRNTLRRIGEYLIQSQGNFCLTGEYQFLQSLTRTQLARDLGIHESTVSRATQGKFVQLSTGETVSFEVFFKPALRIQKMIEEILATENPDNPLSDDRIAELLAKKGVYVARRTVNKYRDRTKLLSSRKRRSA